MWSELDNLKTSFAQKSMSGESYPGITPETDILKVTESEDIFKGLIFSYLVDISAILEKIDQEYLQNEFFNETGFSISGEYPEDEENLDEASKEKLKEKLKPIAIDRIERLFTEIVWSEQPIKGNDNNDQRMTAPLKGLSEEKIKEAGINDLVIEFLDGPDKKRWEMIFDVLNGFAEGASKGLDAKQLSWKNVIDSREAAAGHTDFSQIEALGRRPEVFPVLEEMISLLRKGLVTYYVTFEKDGDNYHPDSIDAKKIKDSAKEKISSLKEQLEDPLIDDEEAAEIESKIKDLEEELLSSLKKSLDGFEKKLVEVIPGQDIPDFAKEIKYNYTQNGEPKEATSSFGTMSTEEYLKQKFPDVPNHIMGVVFMITVIGEFRLKFFAEYYSRYLKSPDSTFDTRPLEVHAPMSRILYAIRAYGRVTKEFRLLWQIFRLPEKDLDHALTEEVKYPTKDKKLFPYRKGDLTEDNLLDYKFNALDGEFLPKNAKLKADGESYKNDPDTAVDNDNVERAIEVRDHVRTNFTIEETAITPVRLPSDLFILSMPCDVMFSDLVDPNNLENDSYNKETFKLFNEAYTYFAKFLKEIQLPINVKTPTEAKQKINSLARKISPFKAFFGLMPEDTTRGIVFRKMIQQSLLIITKNIFNQLAKSIDYKSMKGLTKYGKLTFREFFVSEIAMEEFVIPNTLIRVVANYLGNIFKRYENSQHISDFFSTATGSVFGKFAIAEDTGLRNPIKITREAARREALIDSVLSDTPLEDEK